MNSPSTHHLGVHAPDRPTGSAAGYSRGGLRAWLALLGLKDGGGAPVAVKIYDEAQRWRHADVPEFSKEFQDIFDDCRALHFTPVVSYCAFTRTHPADEFLLQGNRGALSAAMRQLVWALPRGTAVIFCNERENSWAGDPTTFFDLEAEFGVIAQQSGLRWYVGADLVEAHTLDTIEQRGAAWRRWKVVPDAIAFHSYGQSGTLPRHVQDIQDALLRITKRKWPLIWTEWGWGFPGEGKTRGDRRDLDQVDVGAWCGEFALALQAANAAACAFTLDQHFLATGNPTPAAEEFAHTVSTGDVVAPRNPPAEQAKKKTLQYLCAGRSAIGRALARVQAAMA